MKKAKHATLFNGYPLCNTHYLNAIDIAKNHNEITCKKCKIVIKNKQKSEKRLIKIKK